MRAKRSSLIQSPGKGGGEDPFDFDDVQGGRQDKGSPVGKLANPQKHTIVEYENQLASVKKTKDALV